jgi:hypothetical protein
MVQVVGALVTFLVSLLIGSLGIYVAARIVADERSYEFALVTALVGALVWAVVNAFLRGVPLVGPFLPLVAWVWVIRWRYSEGWLDAAIIGFVAWLLAVVVLEVVLIAGVDVFGIPFI